VGVYGTLSTLDIAAAIGILSEADGVIENSQGDAISLSSESQKAYMGNGKTLTNNIRTLLET
jgi:fructose-1,6-bisphosphatase/inositol monophosphatase family enzyme